MLKFSEVTKAAAFATALMLTGTTAEAGAWIDFQVDGMGSNNSMTAANVNFTITYQPFVAGLANPSCAANGTCISKILIDLTAGTDTNAGGSNAVFTGLTPGLDASEVTFAFSNTEGPNNNLLTITFDSMAFDPGNRLTFTADIKELMTNSGGNFGDRAVGVSVMLENGETGVGVFQNNGAAQSRVSVHVPEPATLGVLGLGLFGLGVASLRRRPTACVA
jgi:hypothetical protein